MSEKVIAKIDRVWPARRWNDLTVLIAVSGGADSVALLRAVHLLRGNTANGKIVVAHYDHQVRADSADDATFVQDLAQQLQLECVVGQAGDVACGGLGLEAAMRDARYKFLCATAESVGARYVATGHTQDDQVETALHNALRGTGLRGLAGIPVSRPLNDAVSLIRPMLTIPRIEIESYLGELNQSYRVDDSNRDPGFTRNRIRHELLPLLEAEYYPGVRKSLLSLTQLAAGAQGVLDSLANALLENCVIQRTRETSTVNLQLFNAADEFVRGQALIQLWTENDWPRQDMSRSIWSKIVATAESDPDHEIINLPGNVRAEFTDHRLALSRGRERA